MPAKSEAQRKYLNWKFGHKWTVAHHFDNPGKLPEHVKRKRVSAATHPDPLKRKRAMYG